MKLADLILDLCKAGAEVGWDAPVLDCSHNDNGRELLEVSSLTLGEGGPCVTLVFDPKEAK